jgi:hypothetical protein
MRRHPKLHAAMRVARSLASAVVLGVATMLLVKREPDQHWSEPPIVIIADEHDQATQSGDRPAPATR